MRRFHRVGTMCKGIAIGLLAVAVVACAISCSATNSVTQKSDRLTKGMTPDEARGFLDRAGFAYASVEGSWAYPNDGRGETLEVEDPKSDEILRIRCWEDKDKKIVVQDIYWYIEGRKETEKGIGQRKGKYIKLDSVSAAEIRETFKHTRR